MMWKQTNSRKQKVLGKVLETLKVVLCYFSALDTVNSPGNLSQMIKDQLTREQLKTLGRDKENDCDIENAP